MGILKSLFTLGKSFISQAEESIEETQGVRMLEQHIRDAKAELDKAGKSRVDLLARVKLSHDKLKDLRERKASLEARALEALSKNVNPSLINEVAEEIARLENLITAEEQVLSNLEVSRDGVEKAVTATAQRIAQFEQQMEVVKATEAMQRAQQAVTTSTVGASSSVSTAPSADPQNNLRRPQKGRRIFCGQCPRTSCPTWCGSTAEQNSCGPAAKSPRHCEARSDVAIPLLFRDVPWTTGLPRPAASQ